MTRHGHSVDALAVSARVRRDRNRPTARSRSSGRSPSATASGRRQYADGIRTSRSQRDTSWRLTVGTPATVHTRWASDRCDHPSRCRAAAIKRPGEGPISNTPNGRAVCVIAAPRLRYTRGPRVRIDGDARVRRFPYGCSNGSPAWPLPTPSGRGWVDTRHRAYRRGVAVADLPFDLTDPPDLPPKDVRHAMLWRVAICLFRAHSAGFPAGVLVHCRVCGHVWPCPARRLAERALIEACGPATAAGDA